MFKWLRSITEKFHALLNKGPLTAGVNSKGSSLPRKEKQLNAVLLMIDGNNESDKDSEKENAPIKFLLSLLAMSVTSAIPTKLFESSFYSTLN